MSEPTLPDGVLPTAETQQIILVSATSSIKGVAGEVAQTLRENEMTLVQALGAVAVNRAIKALALARDYLLSDNLGIVCTPQFVEIEDQHQTAVCFTVKAFERTLHETNRSR